MTIQIERATKTQAYLRLAVAGPTGSGKTWTPLRIARGMLAALGSDRLPLLIDTEAGSASKYADEFAFDTIRLDSFHPQGFIDSIVAAEKNGYPVLIIDSLSHAWMGKDGVMEQVDRNQASMRSKFAAWKDPSLLHQRLIDTILHARLHVIATMRSKMEYVQEGGEIKRLGMAPVQREGTEYEFDVVLDMDQKHNGRVSKSRIASLADLVIEKPGEELGTKLVAWLTSGAPMVERKGAEVAATPQEAPQAPQGEPVDDALLSAIITVGKAKGAASKADIEKWLAARGYGTWGAFALTGAKDAQALLTYLQGQKELLP